MIKNKQLKQRIYKMTTNVGCIDLDLGSSPYDNLSTTLDKAYDAIEDFYKSHQLSPNF